MLRGVTHGADFHFGRAGGNADNHTERGGEPVALSRCLLHQTANHKLGGVEVGDDTLAQGADGADALRFLALHQLGLFADGNQLIGASVESHD